MVRRLAGTDFGHSLTPSATQANDVRKRRRRPGAATSWVHNFSLTLAMEEWAHCPITRCVEPVFAQADVLMEAYSPKVHDTEIESS